MKEAKVVGLGKTKKLDNKKMLRKEGTLLDGDKIAAALEEELKDVDIDTIVREVRDEIDEKARKKYPKLGDGTGEGQVGL